MARVCIDKKWYEQVEPSTFSEQLFEDRIDLHAPSVYPHYYVVPFKKLLVPEPSTLGTNETIDIEEESDNASINRGVVADLAFISKDYKEWWVVEVEMGYHNFTSHVMPQVQKLLNARYARSEAEYLCEKNVALDLEKLTKLMQDSPARLLLIINQPRPDWVKKLSKLGVVVAVFELFKASDGKELFRVNGEYPNVLGDKISRCTFHQWIPRLLGIDEPGKLDIPHGTILKLLFNNCVTEWTRIDEGEQIWLSATGRNPLDSEKQYEIYSQNDGQLVLRSSMPIELRGA